MHKLRAPEERIVLITGASDGIGLQTAIQIAAQGSLTVIHGRNTNKLQAAREKILVEVKARRAQMKLTPNLATSKLPDEPRIELAAADLSSLDEVRALAEEISDRFPRLDVLLNNAGVYMKRRELSKDGFEMTFAVNHLAPFLLTNLLLPKLKHDHEGRAVTVASMAHQKSRIDWNNLQAEKSFDGYGTYSLSKLCNILFANELAERMKGSSITSNSLHPGVINTKLLLAGFGAVGEDVRDGAKTTFFVSTSETLNGVTGRYFSGAREAKPSNEAVSMENQKKLWDLSVQMTGLKA